MKWIQYIREKGLKHFFEILWRYKIEIIFEKVMFFFTKNKNLQNIILIESHNDFDCNGGAFYDYLIANHYNQKYRIVWLVKNKRSNYKNLPKNVTCVPLFGPSLRKAYYLCLAKYLLCDCECPTKIRSDQIFVYCSHGAGGLKKIKGKVSIPTFFDYILLQSQKYGPIQAEQWSIPFPSKKNVFIGYPAHDTFFVEDKSEIQKVTHRKYKKVILWMPTFRKGGGFQRNDSNKEQKLGIPLFQTLQEYSKLNDQLKQLDAFLIIKIHPMQDLSDLKIKDLSNIKVLTGKDIKKLKINNYKLMKCTDALISDYSGAAYEYLLLNKPIAYVLDDMKEYKLGFVVEDIHKLIAGHEIYNLNDFNSFISDVLYDQDIYREHRERLRDYIYEYHDGKASERLVDLLGLKKD